MSSSEECLLQKKALCLKARNKLFLHLKYNPGDPDSKIIQKLWRDTMLQPSDKPHLTYLRNSLGERLAATRLVIAYSRHPNIGNLLSYRKKLHQTRAESVILLVIRH